MTFRLFDFSTFRLLESGPSRWAVGVCVLVALIGLLSLRTVPRRWAWSGFVGGLSLAGVITAWPACSAAGGPVARAAWAAAILSLAWSICAALADAIIRAWASRLEPPAVFPPVARAAARVSGAITAILQLPVLAWRLADLSIELIVGVPSHVSYEYGFGPSGLGALALLLAAGGVSFWATRDRRLIVWLFGNMAALIAWACALEEAYASTPDGGFARTSLTLALLAGLSMLLAAAVLLNQWASRQARQPLGRTDHDHSPDVTPLWPGFRAACGVVAMAIIVLACYHLAVPISFRYGGFRVGTVLSGACAGVAAASTFLLVRQRWNVNLAEAGMGLASLALCGLAIAFIPSQPTLLDDRFPMVFTAVTVGMTIATWLWCWLGRRWRRQLATDTASATVRNMVALTSRFAFLTAALALLVASLMAVWPRMPSIATMDDSLGRFAAGVGANLLLLLVLLWCTRQRRRVTFNILTVLAVLSTAGFVVVRMLPFAQRAG